MKQPVKVLKLWKYPSSNLPLPYVQIAILCGKNGLSWLIKFGPVHKPILWPDQYIYIYVYRARWKEDRLLPVSLYLHSYFSYFSLGEKLDWIDQIMESNSKNMSTLPEESLEEELQSEEPQQPPLPSAFASLPQRPPTQSVLFFLLSFFLCYLFLINWYTNDLLIS